MADICDFDTGEIYSGRKTGNIVKGFDSPSAWTPTVDPHYSFPDYAVDIIVWLRHSKDPLYIAGPTGCGKTSCVKQLAAKINYPVFEVTGHNRLEFPELVGHHTVVDGNMRFEYGPLALAMLNGGIFLVNEIDLLDPSTAAGLNSVLDGAPLTIAENGGEIIKAHPQFRFLATANTAGRGDASGAYQGALRMNMAFMDRFTVLQADYATPDVEKAVIKAHVPALPDNVIAIMLEFAGGVRRLFNGETVEHVSTSVGLSVTLSLRTLIRWAYMTQQYAPLKANKVDVLLYSLYRALLFRVPPAEQLTLREYYQRLVGDGYK